VAAVIAIGRRSWMFDPDVVEKQRAFASSFHATAFRDTSEWPGSCYLS
jgi:hypothetical protein